MITDTYPTDDIWEYASPAALVFCRTNFLCLCIATIITFLTDSVLVREELSAQCPSKDLPSPDCYAHVGLWMRFEGGMAGSCLLPVDWNGALIERGRGRRMSDWLRSTAAWRLFRGDWDRIRPWPLAEAEEAESCRRCVRCLS